MPQERLTFYKIREILRLKEEVGLSNRAIIRARKISNSTVGEYLRGLAAANLHWPLADGSTRLSCTSGYSRKTKLPASRNACCRILRTSKKG